MENLEFWNKYKDVPANALKKFDNGKFKGTDINTMWRIKSLTETFGMCGAGWYFEIVKTWSETTPNNEMFAFAEIKLYVKINGEWSMPISGNGGNKIARVTKDGKVSTSDEAYKMAVTDAIGVACRNLGMGANVYWENDKTKYTEIEEPVNYCSKEQIDRIRELKCNEENILKRYRIESIDRLTKTQAEFVITTKEKAGA